MIIVSQNGEKVLAFGISFNGLEYFNDTKKKNGKIEAERHTICISDGCLEEIAEYSTKERCLEVLESFCNAYEDACHTEEFFDHSASAARPATYIKNTVFRFPEK